jgi:REP element-mobilizing transposase RayT
MKGSTIMLERADYVEGRGSSVSQKLRMARKDYSREGWYFVTLSVERRRLLFGTLNLDPQGKADMRCNALGQLVERCWCEIPGHYPEVQLGAFQVMPDHFHGLVWLDRGNNKPLGEIMNIFKGAVTRLWRRAMPVDSRYSGKEQASIWQPNYYDVICFEAEELAIKEAYIKANPQRWALKRIPRGTIKTSKYLGNQELLKASPKRALRMPRKASEKEIEETKRLWGEAWEGIVVSTFFSPGERAVLDALLTQPQSRIIWIMPMGLPEHIPVKWGKALLEGRALWLSAYPDEQQEATRTNCMEGNEWAERLALGLRH